MKKTELLVFFVIMKGFQNNFTISSKWFVLYLENQYFLRLIVMSD